MDEARFVFEFVDRSGNTGGGSKSPAGQPAPGSSNTAEGFTDAANAAGGAASLADKNAGSARGKGSSEASVPIVMPVAPSPAASTKDTTKIFDTAVDLTAVATQAGRALSGAPTSVADVFGRSKSLGEAVSKAVGITQELLKKPPQVSAPLAVPPVDARVSPLDVMSTSERTQALTDKVLGEAKKSRAESASALRQAADPDAAREAARAAGRAASVQKRLEAGEAVKMSAQAAEKAGVVTAEVVKDGASSARTAAGVAQVGATVARAATTAGTGTAASAGGMALAAGGPLALAALPAVVVAGAFAAANKAAETATQQADTYSPDLAQAKAQAEVRQIQADIRTANRLGAELARGVDVRSSLSESLQGLRDTLSKPFIERTNDIVEILSMLASKADQAAEGGESLWGKAVKFSANPPLMPGFFEWAAKVSRAIEGQKKPDSFVDWFDKQPFPAPASTAFNPNEVVAGAAFDQLPGLGNR